MPALPLFPPQASTMAGKVDALYFFLVAVSAFFVVVIAVLVIYFGIRYRRRAHGDVGQKVVPALSLEIAWTVVRSSSASSCSSGRQRLLRPGEAAAETLDIYVVGKQWMWKFQHLDGQAGDNDCTCPWDGRSESPARPRTVFHSFFVPAFRVKADVLPGATRPSGSTRPRPDGITVLRGILRHEALRMIGIDRRHGADRLPGVAGRRCAAEGSLASQGQKAVHGPRVHHVPPRRRPGPRPRAGRTFGARVELNSGPAVVADDAYLRESILSPSAKVASIPAGDADVPGLVSEEQLLALIEYIKSLKGRMPAQPATEPQQLPKK